MDTRIFPDAHEPAFVSESTLRTCSGADPLGPAPISQLGAVESEYLKTIEDAGFTETRIVGRLDYFGVSASENT